MNERNEVNAAATENAAATVVEATRSQTRTILRVIFLVLAVAAVLWALYSLEGVLLLVVLAIFFAYLIAPLVDFVRRPFNLRGREHVMPRGVAIAIVYLVLFGLLAFGLWFLLPRLGTQITEFAKQAPAYFTSAKARTQSLDRFYDSYGIPKAARDKINENVSNLITAVGRYSTESLGNFLLESLGYLPWLVLIPILAFFLLKDADSFRRSALQMLPRGRWRWRGDEFFQDVNSTLAAYIRAQLTACLLIGTICTIGFYFIGVPYFFLLGLLAGMLEFIPLVGPLAVAIVAALITSFYSFNQAIVVIVFLFVLRIVHDYVVYPRIIGQGIHLHPLAVILAILSGAELAGAAGIFLAIPVVAITTVTYRHWLEHRGSEGLIGEILKPADTLAAAAATAPTDAAPSTAPPVPPKESAPKSQQTMYPTTKTTPDQMARARPDLTTGELKLKDLE